MAIENNGTGIFTPPRNIGGSERYCDRFNKVAKEMGVALEWVEDGREAFLVNPEELRVAAEALKKYKVDGPTPKAFSEELKADVLRVLTEVERRRLAAVEKSALSHKRVIYRVPIEKLSPVEQEAARLLEEDVLPHLNRIEAIQFDPNAWSLAQYMEGDGDYYSQIMFSRFHRDTCAGKWAGDESCSLFPFFPHQPPVNGMIDPAVAATVEQFAEVSKGWAADDERMRPTTFLARDKRGAVVATPAPLVPALVADHRAMAAALDKIADIAVKGERLNPKLQKQLHAWARFFRTGTAADEAAAVQATIDTGEDGGRLRVHLGPSESYWDDNTKFPYLMQVGIIDDEIAQSMARVRQDFFDVEQALADIPHYAPRKISSRGGFANPMEHLFTGGFYATFPLREPLGNEFPNYAGYAKYGVEGSTRFISLDGERGFVEQERTALVRLSDEDLSDWNTLRGELNFTIQHESSHLLGPTRDHATPSGREMCTVFGAHWSQAEEPKADLMGLEILSRAARRGAIGPDEFQDIVRSVVANHFSNRYKGKEEFFSPDGLPAHYYGHVIQAGNYFKNGAVTIVTTAKGEQKFHIDYDKVVSASRELYRKIVAFQAAGDVEGFLRMGNELAAAIPDEADQMILKASADVPMFFVERY